MNVCDQLIVKFYFARLLDEKCLFKTKVTNYYSVAIRESINCLAFECWFVIYKQGSISFCAFSISVMGVR